MSVIDTHGNVHDRSGRFGEQSRPEAAVTLSPRDALQAKRDRLVAGRSTEQLVLDLRNAERLRSENNTEQARMVAAWLTDEVLDRLPEVRERVHAFLDDDDSLDDERTTGQVIEDSIRDLAAGR
ncbi:hypothetical protein ACWGJ9_08670 [Curtobacterium citreum]